MSHFKIEDWADFVRGLGEPAHKAAMEGHLAAGCLECAGIVGRLRSASAVLAAEAARPVPETVLARARAIFSPSQAPLPSGRLASLLAELVFDSWTTPGLVPAGVRGMSGTRQLSYRAGNLRLDLSIEPAPKSPRLLLTGQVHGRRTGNEMRVKVVCGDRTVAESATSEFGEFALEAMQHERLSLHIENLRGGLGIIVSLTPLFSAGGDPPATNSPEKKS
ncbi:MAG: hypothetical protein IT162_07975 [Bryobacterales bacterium]|nr:hypothetical protein [Bryobacterales bacterium]